MKEDRRQRERDERRKREREDDRKKEQDIRRQDQRRDVLAAAGRARSGGGISEKP